MNITVNETCKPVYTLEKVTLELDEDEALYVTALLGIGNERAITGEDTGIYTTLRQALGVGGLRPTNPELDERYAAMVQAASRFIARYQGRCNCPRS